MRTRPRPTDPSTATRTVLAASPVRVTVVESEACHFCADAHQVLLEASANYPLEVRTVDVRSPEGEELMQTHRATMSPLVLLDGEFFSNGRLPRRKLVKALGQRFGEPTTTCAAGRDGVGRG